MKIKIEKRKQICCHCLELSSGEYAIDRDGLVKGPRLLLCGICGTDDGITPDKIWERLRFRRAALGHAIPGIEHQPCLMCLEESIDHADNKHDWWILNDESRRIAICPVCAEGANWDFASFIYHIDEIKNVLCL